MATHYILPKATGDANVNISEFLTFHEKKELGLWQDVMITKLGFNLGRPNLKQPHISFHAVSVETWTVYEIVWDYLSKMHVNP